MMVKALQFQLCRWSWKPLTSVSISSFSLFPQYPINNNNNNPFLKLVSTSTNAVAPRFAPFRASSSSSSSSASAVPANVRSIKFCQWCGGSTKHDIPDGEEKFRAICTVCARIAYQNPKMVVAPAVSGWRIVELSGLPKPQVVGCLIEHNNKVLLCKRNIQPSHGLWTLPAGYLEMGESAVEGAIRETREEANADVEIYMIFLARLKTPHFSPGPESSECQLFPLDDIPFNSLSFSSMVVTLNLYVEDIKAGKPKFHYGTIKKRPGTSPSDINAYTLDHHMHT